jgi:hypothetical protein
MTSLEGQEMGRLLLLLLSLSAVAFAEADPLETTVQRNDVATAVTSRAVYQAESGIMISWIVENQMPRDAAALGEIGERVPPESAPESGVGALRIDRGTIIVTLGGNVHDGLNGKVFALAPCVKDHSVEFACGRSQCPAGYSLAPGAPDALSLTTLDPMQMPARCR